MDKEFFLMFFMIWVLSNSTILFLFNYNQDIDVIINECYIKFRIPTCGYGE